MHENDVKRKVILFIAMSLDGYIATKDEDLSFLNRVAAENEDYGYTEFLSGVDTIIMGRKTYDWVMRQVEVFPHAHLTSYIITRTPRPSIGKTHFYTGDLCELVQKIKKEVGKDIYCDGGAEIANELLMHGLIDEFIISIIPVMLGDGIRLFKDGRPEVGLELVDVTGYEKGLVQVRYKSLVPGP